MIVTTLSRQNFAQARKGTATFYQPTHIGIGRGGLSGGSPRIPAASETALADEILKKAIDTVTVSNVNVIYEVTFDETEANGEAISEVAFFRETSPGVFVMMGIDTFESVGKTAAITLTFRLTETS